MEAVLERKKWVAPTRKLTAEEVEALIENYDYDPEYEEDEYRESEPIYDEYGNPTRDMIAALYENRHGLTTPTTLEDLFTWADSLK